jgi:phage gpG-like protein
MASGIKVTLNHSGMGALLRSAEVRNGLDPYAQAVKAAQESAVPVESGALRDSITVTDDTTDRAVKRIGSNLPYAAKVEADTGFMSRSLDAAG